MPLWLWTDTLDWLQAPTNRASLHKWIFPDFPISSLCPLQKPLLRTVGYPEHNMSWNMLYMYMYKLQEGGNWMKPLCAGVQGQFWLITPLCCSPFHCTSWHITLQSLAALSNSLGVEDDLQRDSRTSLHSQQPESNACKQRSNCSCLGKAFSAKSLPCQAVCKGTGRESV